MISIDRTPLDPPKVLNSRKLDKVIKKSLREKNNHRFSKYYINRIGKGLKKLYNKKCGYCETPVEAGTVLEFDHYRPKNGIKEDKSHTGYYWLGYEWSNLIPACPNCNRQKSNAFPINGKRAKVSDFYNDPEQLEMNNTRCKADSPLLKSEKPLLLHPEIDTPENHMTFLPSGEVEAAKDRGKKTIEICGLNREGLILARMKIINGHLDDIREVLDDFITGKISRKTLRYCLEKLFKNISENGNPKKPYSRLGWYMFHKFDSFFIEPLEVKQQRVLRKAIKLFKEYGSIRKKKTN